MKRKTLIIVSVALIAALLVTLVGIDALTKAPQLTEPKILVGVDVGFGDENDVYKVADAIQGYANLMIIGSLAVTGDTVKLTRVCDYLYQKGFSFIIYIGFGPAMPNGPSMQFFRTTAEKWGEKFLGAYIFDEPGGKQLDYAPGTAHYSDKPVKQADNYSDAAKQYVDILFQYAVHYAGPTYYDVPNLKVFTSDYALYWFDYLSGYNVVLGEFVGNESRQLTIARCRGAANVHLMNWGTMITWKYDQAPFLEDAEQLYTDMILAYENGAKYVVVFNSPANQTATTDLGILTSQHLNTMKRFWTYVTTHPYPDGYQAEIAYVLPRDYGFGFRGPEDNIWGIWPADGLAPKIWSDTNTLIAQHGKKIDVVYETLIDNLPTRLMYKQLIYWNGTINGRLDN